MQRNNAEVNPSLRLPPHADHKNLPVAYFMIEPLRGI